MPRNRTEHKIMTIEEAFRSDDFISYRNYRISKADMDFIKNLLEQKNGIRRVKKLLRVIGYLPDDLLPKIVHASLEFNDPSMPKRWIHHVLRIYSEHKVQEEIFKIIRVGSRREVMNSMTLLYYIKPSIRKMMRGEEKKMIECSWKWNGSNYEECINEDISPIQIEESATFKRRRIDFLIDEFLSCDNLVKKYYLGLWIKMYDNWPTSNKINFQKALNEINGINFPRNYEELRSAIEDNEVLVKYCENE